MNILITDYITGNTVRNAGAETSRQEFEKFLVETKGFEKTDVRVDVPLTVQFKGEDYESKIDLIVCCNETPVMAVTCVAGSLGSYEREILAGARLVYDTQIPLAISTDARDASVLDTLTGEKVGKGIDAVPSKAEALEMLEKAVPAALEENRVEKEMIIYRSFNLEKVNY